MDLNEDSDEVQSKAEIEDASEASDGDDDDEEEEGDPSKFIDVLDVLDGRGDPESEDEHQDAKKTSSLKTDAAQMSEDEEEDEEMNSEEDSEEDEDEDDKMGSASEPEDEEDDSALQDLEQFVSGLDAGQKRKAPDEDDGKDVDPKPAARKRRLLPERTELGAENEFAPALSA